MKRKIAILTQPLIFNYGGILQNFALQYVLKTLGCEVTTINRIRKPSDLKILIGKIKRLLFNHHQNKLIFNSQKAEIYKHTKAFIEKNIQCIDAVNSTNESLRNICENNYDAIIVGSDQVWRPQYVNNIYNEFFDFLADNSKIKKYAYAASFGADKWMFTDEQTARCKELIQKFEAVSVREDSGVLLCADFLDKEACAVIDPTLLVPKEVYEALCSQFEKIDYSKKHLFTYVLDQSAGKDKLINDIVVNYNFEHTTNQAKFSLEGNKDKEFVLEDFIYPEIEGWLRGFRDADFIITDSFHGTVFSIIFNKPFFAIVNEQRGASRFQSLLAKLQLEDRLITINTEISDELFNKKIDFEKVNSLLGDLKSKALDFLKTIVK